jgi:hypothetical protein
MEHLTKGLCRHKGGENSFSELTLIKGKWDWHAVIVQVIAARE